MSARTAPLDFLDRLVDALSHHRRGRTATEVTPAAGFADRFVRALAREPVDPPDSYAVTGADRRTGHRWWSRLPALAYAVVAGGIVVLLLAALPRAVELVGWWSLSVVSGLLTASSLAASRRDRARLEAISATVGRDPLTGLADRATLLVRGDDLLRARGRAGQAALLLFDLDGFRNVNDTLGHAAGDDLLREVATRLQAQTGPGELLGRLGGDEFALLVPVPADHAHPDGFALERARTGAAALAQPMAIEGMTLSVETSVGVVVAATGAPTAELLRRADVAIRQAKRDRTTVVAYDATGDVASTDRLALLAELRTALGVDDQLVLALQPIVDLRTGAPIRVEALIRWNHPRRGMLPPNEFVGAVEESDLLGPFTRYVIDHALGVVARWAADGVDVPVAVNLSARSLRDTSLPAEVAELLSRHAVAPAKLVLEITESVTVADSEVVHEVLGALRRLGVQIAVDDFGTGYSSLAFLTRSQVDEVKVDRAFVSRMAESPAAAAIVRSTVELGRSLGVRVIAEGVETAEQRAALAALGYSGAQGSHLHPPMSVDKARKVLGGPHQKVEDRPARSA